MRQRDAQHFLGCGHFQVERQVGRILDAAQVIVADMAAILAQMGGDAVAAGAGDDLRRAHRIGMISAARVADRRHMVDIHAQAQPADARRRRHLARLPGFTIGSAASSGGSSSSA